MNFEVIVSYLPRFIEAFWLTVRIGFIGIGISFIIGIITAFAVHFKIPFLSGILGIYVELFRNTPLLVQLFFIYFGLPKVGITISAQTCGCLGIGLLGGSYMAESFRSGLEAVPFSQSEGALALGLSRAQMFFYVILPEAFALSVPAIIANTAKDLIGLHYNTAEALFLLVFFYAVMLIPISILGNVIEKRIRFKMFGV